MLTLVRWLSTWPLWLLHALGSMLGSGIQAEARRTSGKCKPSCGICQTCDRGKCKKKNGKKKNNKPNF